MKKQNKKRINRVLLCIDMQNDFTSPNGSMYIQNSDKDVTNVADMFNHNPKFFRECVFTLDTHTHNHLTICENWVNNTNGYTKNCKPYTKISKSDIESNLYRPKNESISKEYLLSYLEACENKHHEIILWPSHCILNTNGWNINSNIYNATNKCNILQSFFYKGECEITEFYSAIEPIVVIENDRKSHINVSLLHKLLKYDEIYVCGEAMDFCVLETIKDLVKYHSELANKIYILEDCMSAIDASKTAHDVFDFIIEKGGKIIKSTNI